MRVDDSASCLSGLAQSVRRKKLPVHTSDVGRPQGEPERELLNGVFVMRFESLGNKSASDACSSERSANLSQTLSDL